MKLLWLALAAILTSLAGGCAQRPYYGQDGASTYGGDCAANSLQRCRMMTQATPRRY